MESLPDAMAELEFRNPLNIIEGDPTQFQNFADFRSQVVEPVGVGVIRVGSFAANLSAGAPMIVRRFERWYAGNSVWSVICEVTNSNTSRSEIRDQTDGVLP
jgi:hypothetical protein